MKKYNKLKKSQKRRVKKNKSLKKRGGNGNDPLPPAETTVFSLLPNVCQNNQYYDSNPSSTELKGGYIKGGINGNLEVPIFDAYSDIFKSFKRVTSEMDCVINAMQLIGLIDNFSANILRLTSISKLHGISKDEIEKIFAFKFNRKFAFEPTTNFNTFKDSVLYYLNDALEKTKSGVVPIGRSAGRMIEGLVAFCGVEYQDNTKHVFLIGINPDKNIFKIDPQVNPPICNLTQDPLCIQSLTNNVKTYYLLYVHPNKLTNQELQQLGIVYENYSC